MVAQTCKYTKNHWIVHFEWSIWYVNFILISLLFNIKAGVSKTAGTLAWIKAGHQTILVAATFFTAMHLWEKKYHFT